MPPKVPLLYGIVFCYPGYFVFPYEADYCSFKVCEELCWDINEGCIDSIDCFGGITIFTMLILPIQKHGRSFHFSGMFFNFFL